MTSAAVRRERNDGLYQPMTYLAFKISEEITVTLLHSLPVSVMMFYTVQLKVRLLEYHYSHAQSECCSGLHSATISTPTARLCRPYCCRSLPYASLEHHGSPAA